MRTLIGAGSVLFFGAAVLFGNEVVNAQPPSSGGWQGCCGAAPWPHGPEMMGGGHMGMMGSGATGGSMTRNHAAMVAGVPAPYTSLRNPLPQTAATIERGAKIYTENCASCHGAAGYGDGPAAGALNPRPADLAQLSRMPLSRWDPFMFWTVSEGGAPVGSAMPSFKSSLSEADRWAVVGYIQAHLPQPSAGR